ncbi:MAG: DUF4918 domain-containing protein [Bacteroidetes bacterium]|nr:MAG: DUF4918 domain-containing protein [Bacteroidota bacterium]
MTYFCDKILNFYANVQINVKLPEGVDVMNPYGRDEVIEVVTTFYQKYYADTKHRTLILGINPGRFGAGITGIPFTDPVRLEDECKIKNSFDHKPELSSIFIYQMINAFGSIEAFYKQFYISSISPLGFIKDGKNMNYYDSKALQNVLYDFILESIQKQLNFGINREVCYSLGQGKNYKYLLALNKEHHFFKKVIPLAHPRYILQYKRKFVDDYLKSFLSEFRKNG